MDLVWCFCGCVNNNRVGTVVVNVNTQTNRGLTCCCCCFVVVVLWLFCGGFVVFCRYQSRFTDAARVFEKAGHVDLAIEMFLDLKRYDDAKNYAGKGSSKHSVSDLMKRQAEWSKATADWRSASEMYVWLVVVLVVVFGGWWLVVVLVGGWLVVVFGGEQCCLVVVLFGVGSNFLIFGMLLFDCCCLIVGV